MTKTNHELAREAAGVLWKQDRQTFESVTRIIADTYAEAFPRWIPCSERMPEVGVEVLITNGKRKVVATVSEFITPARWCIDQGETIAVVSTNQYGYWQPLPQPPEAVT